MGVALELAELGARYGLDPDAMGTLRLLLELIAGDPRAPTTVRDPDRVLKDHLADSLSGLLVPAVRAARTLADLGSGAGFPGLALAIALPSCRVALVESVHRKCEFLERAVSALELGNVSVICARVEGWSEGRGACDVVTTRAVAQLAVVAEYAAPLLRVGGMLVAWRGRRDVDAEAAAERAAALVGLAMLEPIAVKPYDGADHRHLHVMSKVRETPARFPRRPGVAGKRPLGR